MGNCGIGSEENYAYLAEQTIGNYLKNNTFHWEKRGKMQTIPIVKKIINMYKWRKLSCRSTM